MKSFTSNQITKNLLKNNMCETCKHVGPGLIAGGTCLFWYGETVGWQWRKRPEEGTCEYYEKRDN